MPLRMAAATPGMETGREYELAVELMYPLRRIGLQQVNQLQQATLLVGALPCARSERCEDGADLWGNERGEVLAQRS